MNIPTCNLRFSCHDMNPWYGHSNLRFAMLSMILVWYCSYLIDFYWFDIDHIIWYLIRFYVIFTDHLLIWFVWYLLLICNEHDMNLWTFWYCCSIGFYLIFDIDHLFIWLVWYWSYYDLLSAMSCCCHFYEHIIIILMNISFLSF